MRAGYAHPALFLLLLAAISMPAEACVPGSPGCTNCVGYSCFIDASAWIYPSGHFNYYDIFGSNIGGSPGNPDYYPRFKMCNVTENVNHIYYVMCIDAWNNTGSTAWLFNTDYTKPDGDLLDDAHMRTSDASPDIHVLITDNLAPYTNFMIFLNRKPYMQNHFPVYNNTLTTVTIDPIDLGDNYEGVFNLTYEAADIADNRRNLSKTLLLNITGDIVYLISPGPYTSFNTTNITFSFKFLSKYSPVMNCSIFINNVLNATNRTTLVNTTTNFSLTGLPESPSVKWGITCLNITDPGVNANDESYIAIDMTPPHLVSWTGEPPNGAEYIRAMSGAKINITLTVADNLAVRDVAVLEHNITANGTFVNTTIFCYGGPTPKDCKFPSNIPIIPDLAYRFRIYINDSLNWMNVSEWQDYRINISRNYILYLNDTDWDLYGDTDGDIWVPRTTRVSTFVKFIYPDQGTVNLERNGTYIATCASAEGCYYYNTYDAKGAFNMTATFFSIYYDRDVNVTHTIYVGNLNLSFVDPTPENGTTIYAESCSTVNISVKGVFPLKWAYLYWNGVPLAMAINSTDPKRADIQMPCLSNGTYIYYAIANSTYGDDGITENRTLIIGNWTERPRWDAVVPPDGIFEPPASSATGTHVSNFSIIIVNLSIDASERINCTIKATDTLNVYVSATGVARNRANLTLNYLIKPTDDVMNRTVEGYLPWIIKGCTIYDAGGNPVYYGNESKRIYVHKSGYWGDDDVTRAVACEGSPGVFFNNTAKCKFDEDTILSLRMRNGADVNKSCFNAKGVACSDPLCRGIAFQSCDPLVFFAGYESRADDPNNYASFTTPVGSYSVPVAYTQYTNSTGNFKLRIVQPLDAKQFSVTIFNLPDVNSTNTNVYGSGLGHGITMVTQEADGSWNVAFNDFTPYTGILDFTFNVSFNQSGLDLSRQLKLVIAFGTENNQGSPPTFTMVLSPSFGLRNDNESANSSITTDYLGRVCGDRVNNDFDYDGRDSRFAISFDCFDEDCDMYNGDLAQTNEFSLGGQGGTVGGTYSGLCTYGIEMNCSDRFDNDYDYLLSNYGYDEPIVDFTDCHDADCFQKDPVWCPANETICNDHFNNDWDYVNTDSEMPNKIGENGTDGMKYSRKYNRLADLTDCEDPDCNNRQGGASPDQICTWGHELNCSDGFNNDALQLMDCQLATLGGTKAMPVAQDAEYDCTAYCRANVINVEKGSNCNDNLDNDFDAVTVLGYYNGTANLTYGAGTDCRWLTYNPDEDCDNETLGNGKNCTLGVELNCTDGFDNDYDHDATTAEAPSPNWSAEEYQNIFSMAMAPSADFTDYDCQHMPQVPSSESLNVSWCFDGIDNDMDNWMRDPDQPLLWIGSIWQNNTMQWVINSSGGIDCSDPDCIGFTNPLNPNQTCLTKEYDPNDEFFQDLAFPGFYCDNKLDDDVDNALGWPLGGIDCKDPDCNQMFDMCEGPCYMTENSKWNMCMDSFDNNYDPPSFNVVDCADPTCVGMMGNANGAFCQSSETACDDGFDNNRNGKADCADPGCDGMTGGYVGGTPALCAAQEAGPICFDGFDNDGNGVMDCNDPDCFFDCGLSIVNGVTPIALPQMGSNFRLNGITGTYVSSYTRMVRVGNMYSITLYSSTPSSGTEWSIGTSQGPFSRGSFNSGAAYLSGPNAGNFYIIHYQHGFIVKSTSSMGSYSVTLNMQATSVMPSSSYEITYAENTGSKTSMGNYISYQIVESNPPSVNLVRVVPSSGMVPYGSQAQIRASVTDDSGMGRCDWHITGPGGFDYTPSSSTSCTASFTPALEGSYSITVTPVDMYSNVGSPYSTSYSVNLVPTGSGTQINRQGAPFYNTSKNDLLSFNATFAMPPSDSLGACQVIATNESGYETTLTTFGSSGNLCAGTASIAFLPDGLYRLKIRAMETTESNPVSSSTTPFYACSQVKNGSCRMTDFNNDTFPDFCVFKKNLTVLLVSPVEAYATNVTPINFSCFVKDNKTSLSNISLYVWDRDNATLYTNTTRIRGRQNSSNWSVPLSIDQNYTWNCKAYNVKGEDAWSEINRTLIFDTIYPTVWFLPPTPAGASIVSTDYALTKAKANDTNLVNVTIYMFNSSSLFGSNFTNSSDNLTARFNGLANGNYSINASACDIVGQCSWAAPSDIIISTSNDTTPPDVRIISPTNVSIYNYSSILVNVSAQDLHLDAVWVSNGSGNDTYLAPFMKGFPEGNTTLWAFANDTFKNKGSDNVTFNVDTLPPLIFYVYPCDTDMAIINRSHILVVLNVSDPHFANLTIYLYNISGLVASNYLGGLSSEHVEQNFGGLRDGNYTFNATACDYVGHCADAPSWTVYVNGSRERRWDMIIPPEGIFEPLAGLTSGIHVNNFSIRFVNLTLYANETLNCDVKMSNGSMIALSSSGSYVPRLNFLLNYSITTSNSIVRDADVGYLPWIIKNCSIYPTANSSDIVYSENHTARIYTHSPVYWSDDEITRAVACEGSPGVFFNNTAKCKFLGDTLFSLQMRNGNDVNATCFNNPGLACDDPYCIGISFPTCSPTVYFFGKSALSDDPNNFASFTTAFAGYSFPTYYSWYTDPSGNFKLRIRQYITDKEFTFTVFNLSGVNPSGTNVYGSYPGGGTVMTTQEMDGSWNVAYNRLASRYTGWLDFTFNVSFNNPSLNSNRTLKWVVGFGTENNQGTPVYFNAVFNSALGLKNSNESQTSPITTDYSGRVCGDWVNNNFDYTGLNSRFDLSFDCFDPTCAGQWGAINQLNEFPGTHTGLCAYANESGFCNDRFDNDYDQYYANTFEQAGTDEEPPVDFTDCHDADCFQKDPLWCPANETICDNDFNDDWDYVNTDAEVPNKIGENGTDGKKYSRKYNRLADLQDCEDPDCNLRKGGVRADQLCTWGYERNCSDGFNNDALQLMDCQLATLGGTKAMPTVQSAEYDCTAFCRAGVTSVEKGGNCSDNLDNDYDAVKVLDYYYGTANVTYGAGTDCRWLTYNPDEDCDNETLGNGKNCTLGVERLCYDSFDNDFDHDATVAEAPSPNWNAVEYQKIFSMAMVPFADFTDYDCQHRPEVPSSESLNASWCFDGIDNDMDNWMRNPNNTLMWIRNSTGGFDCADRDCKGVTNPANENQTCLNKEYDPMDEYFQDLDYPGLYCDNKLDDDVDNYLGWPLGGTDCRDPDCNKMFDMCEGPCYMTEYSKWNFCMDGLDNDYDAPSFNVVDCADTDCNGAMGRADGAVCQAAETACDDGFDNNRNGKADCTDPSCNGTIGAWKNGTTPLYCRASETAAPDCSDGFDNDADGLIDCMDPGCNSACGLSDISGTNPISLPAMSGKTNINSVTEAYIQDYTKQVRLGSQYNVTFRMTAGSTHAQWTIGTVGHPFNKSPFNTATAQLSGPDAGAFTMIETANGWRIDSKNALPSGYTFMFSMMSSALLPASTYELTYAEQTGSKTSLNNYIYTEIDENIPPIAQRIQVTPADGTSALGSTAYVRAEISDNYRLGLCMISISGPGVSVNANSNTCKASFSPAAEATYSISVTPVDYYSNVGTPISKSYDTNILPTARNISIDRQGAPFYNTSLNETFSVISNFNVPASDSLGTCTLKAFNESGAEFTLASFAAANSTCQLPDISLSALADGIYKIRTDVIETTENNLVIGNSTFLYACSQIQNGSCRMADFNNDTFPDSCIYRSNITVYLLSPVDNYVPLERNNTNFTCGARDKAKRLKNISLSVWDPMFDVYNDTDYANITGRLNSSSWLMDLGSDPLYYWNCHAFGQYVGDAWAESNRTIIFDIGPTQIYFVPPTPNSSSGTRELDVNVTGYDNNLENMTLYLFNGTGELVNETVLVPASLMLYNVIYANYSGIPDGIYYVNATAWDATDYTNSTETRNITVDTVPPAVGIQSPMMITYNLSRIEFNFTVDDLNPDMCWYSSDVSGNDTVGGCANFSRSFEDGDHCIVIFANDTAGNEGNASVCFTVNTEIIFIHKKPMQLTAEQLTCERGDVSAVRLYAEDDLGPLQGVDLSISPAGILASTNENGIYIADSLGNGDYTVSARLPGYYEAIASFTLNCLFNESRPPTKPQNPVNVTNESMPTPAINITNITPTTPQPPVVIVGNRTIEEIIKGGIRQEDLALIIYSSQNCILASLVGLILLLLLFLWRKKERKRIAFSDLL
jgi:hypothetical protein